MAKKKNHNHKAESNNGGEEENRSSEGEKNQTKEEGGGEDKKKKEDKGPMTVIFKVDIHCEGCASKIVKCVRRFDGVDSVKVDTSSNKITIVGSPLDPSKIQEKLHQKTKKRVDLISPQVKKDKENDPKPDKAKAADGNKKSEEKKLKEPQVTTAVLKLALHCQGCIDKIHKSVTKFKGVKEMSVDKDKDLVTVKGTMDVKALTEFLNVRLKRSVEIVSPKKDKDDKESSNGGDNGGGKKKKKKGGDGCGDGGEKDFEGGGEGKMIEGSRMEYLGPPGFGYGYGYGYGYGHGFHHQHPMPGYYEYGYPVGHLHAPAPHIFSDENPNACSVM